MQQSFKTTDVLIPKTDRFDKWAVIACDQFTSDRAYWDRVKETVGSEPSTYHLVFPEIDLANEPKERIVMINNSMVEYIQNDLFVRYPDSFVYVERTLLDGSIRPGIVGAVDLEQYHYDPKMNPSVGATEQTVLERVPPRIAVRRNAELEFSHIILFCNDMTNDIIGCVQKMKDQLPKLYDFMLMEEGGHISGWLISGKVANKIQNVIDAYAAQAEGVPFLVADGNHSLVTAKTWYEELKRDLPDRDLSNHPARYAMVELENIQDPSILFEPIHRVVFDTDITKLLDDMKTISSPDGVPVTWVAGEKKGVIGVDVPKGQLPVAVLQQFLDRWLKENAGKIDYVHDTDAVVEFAKQENTFGLLLPVFDKKELFEFGATGHILPRKTFSLGHGREKRYYLEGRKIR